MNQMLSLIPQVCAQLTDLSKCNAVLKWCGNINPDLCKAKLIALHLTYGGQWSAPYQWGKGIVTPFANGANWAFWKFIAFGHDYLHGIVYETARWWNG